VPQPSLREATAHLASLDPVLAALIDRHGRPPARRPVPADRRFESLAEMIVFQQLAGRAAATIHGRLVEALGGEVTPAAVRSASDELLASCGLSRAKAASIRDLADQVSDGRISLERIGRLPDEAIVDHLTQVRGIGPWTAQMFLLATLGRLDVWPTGDYGVRAGFGRAWQLGGTPSAEELVALGEPFRPYRSLVAWYCWRVADERPGTA
jgi:3-methyladenine DNA glycosylase/8-oxoguanine DNA glycosylase